jgi:large subunit ribosomal protein L6
LPVQIPSGVALTYPEVSIDPATPRTSAGANRFIEVTGPLGTQVVPIAPAVIVSPPEGGAPLVLKVHDAEAKKQRSLWGLTRSLVANAVEGVSKGYTVNLRLVGVGYRAAVEPIPAVFREIQASIPRNVRPAKPGAPPYVLPPLPTDRLNIKLGYAHPVLIDIPHGIKVTTPQPTQIVLTGNDKQKLGLFAAKIRRWRKPEPYRGKVCGEREKSMLGRRWVWGEWRRRGRRRRRRRGERSSQLRPLPLACESLWQSVELFPTCISAEKRPTFPPPICLPSYCSPDPADTSQGIFINDETIKLKDIKKK